MTVQALRPWVPRDNFATRLLLVRRELGLTVKEAAAKCGVHYATWSTWENGRKPADMAEVVSQIAEGLGVDRYWLMWGGSLTGESAKTGPTVRYSASPSQAVTSFDTASLTSAA